MHDILRILKSILYLRLVHSVQFELGSNTIMNTNPIEEQSSLQTKIDKLESSVIHLLSYCNKLAEENETIKNTNNQLMHERSELQTKNDKVRSQVEAMVDRLKAMDKAS